MPLIGPSPFIIHHSNVPPRQLTAAATAPRLRISVLYLTFIAIVTHMKKKIAKFSGKSIERLIASKYRYTTHTKKELCYDPRYTYLEV